MSEKPETAAAPAPAKKSGAMKWVVIGLVAVLLLGGGGGAAWWFLLRKPPVAEGEGEAPKASEKKEEKSKEKGPAGDGLVALDQFLVNLADKDAQRYVRVKLGLVVEKKEEGKEISEEEVKKARLRSAILDVLSQQTAETIVTAEGKAEVKKLIIERANEALGGKKVLDVLFTDFVVQF